MVFERHPNRVNYNQEAKYRVAIYEIIASISFVFTMGTLLSYSLVFQGNSDAWAYVPLVFTVTFGGSMIVAFVKYGLDDQLTPDDRNAMKLIPLSFIIPVYVLYIGETIPVVASVPYFGAVSTATAGALGGFSGVITGLAKRASRFRIIGRGFIFMTVSSGCYHLVGILF